MKEKFNALKFVETRNKAFSVSGIVVNVQCVYCFFTDFQPNMRLTVVSYRYAWIFKEYLCVYCLHCRTTALHYNKQKIYRRREEE